MEKKESREEKAKRVRKQFPECTAVADAFRAAFGDDVRMIYAKENGRELGRSGDRPSDKLVKFKKLVIDSDLPDSLMLNKAGKLVARRGK